MPWQRAALTVLGLVALYLIAAAVNASGLLVIRGEDAHFDARGVDLRGKFAFPRHRTGPFPALVVVHGSGSTTWQDVRGYGKYFAPKGYAVFMFDKRGVGDSGGEYRGISIAQGDSLLRLLADDVRAAIRFVASHPLVDPDQIGLIGGSQAGWVMPLAAENNPRVRLVVAVSGPAVSLGQEDYYSKLTGDDPGGPGPLSLDEIRQRAEAYAGPPGYDPAPVLNALTCPSLWILGGADRSVPTWMSLRALQSLQQAGRPVEIAHFPTGDHSIRDVETGKRIDYRPQVWEFLQRHGLDPSD